VSSVSPSVRPSVCLSVCNALHCRSRGRCIVTNCASVFLEGKLLFVRSDTCCRMYRLVTKMHRKKTSWRKREHEFLRQKTTRVLVYSTLTRSTVENLRRSNRELCSSHLSGLSLGAFIKSTWLPRVRLSTVAVIADRTAVSHRARFVLVMPYVVAVRSAITATVELLVYIIALYQQLQLSATVHVTQR